MPSDFRAAANSAYESSHQSAISIPMLLEGNDLPVYLHDGELSQSLLPWRTCGNLREAMISSRCFHSFRKVMLHGYLLRNAVTPPKCNPEDIVTPTLSASQRNYPPTMHPESAVALPTFSRRYGS
jgi:hypothetical protein